MIDLSALYGNEHIKKVLNGSGNFSSFLIEGPDGSGKHTLAHLIAASRLCMSDGDKKPCGKCLACKKCINELGCPALVLSEETNSKGKNFAAIDSSLCTGCGLCTTICPVNAIE